ncbi:YxlC family protein [Bacillus sp. SCS-153A]|uniref:YxlC family protein n=1 Tax=Rossellomorea sedimentorum TaxID=3115294 RepID=UPI003905A194
MKQEEHEPKNDWDDLQALFDESFKTIDREIENGTPSDHWFEQFTLNQQSQLKHKYRKELGVFMVIAVLMISVILFALYKSIVLFAAIQGAAFIAAVIYSGVSYMRQVTRT